MAAENSNGLREGRNLTCVSSVEKGLLCRIHEATSHRGVGPVDGDRHRASALTGPHRKFLLEQLYLTVQLLRFGVLPAAQSAHDCVSRPLERSPMIAAVPNKDGLLNEGDQVVSSQHNLARDVREGVCAWAVAANRQRGVGLNERLALHVIRLGEGVYRRDGRTDYGNEDRNDEEYVPSNRASDEGEIVSSSFAIPAIEKARVDG